MAKLTFSAQCRAGLVPQYIQRCECRRCRHERGEEPDEALAKEVSAKADQAWYEAGGLIPLALPAEPVSAVELGGLATLRVALEMLRQIDPELKVLTAQVFLAICDAHEDGAAISDLAKLFGKPVATISRHVADLGPINRHRREGYGLISHAELATDRRRKMITLTSRGLALRKALLGACQGDSHGGHGR